ncbi:MAG: glycosyltransferase [Planctomycetota bacterium]|nr:MAG: glycosyltransferase [Planctomycetota bacterium]
MINRKNSNIPGMLKDGKTKSDPLVSVLIPTFNRPRCLSEALASVLRQSYRNLQVIVINDGGKDVSDIVNSAGDSRLVFINRKRNCGKAFSLNEALARAEGKYVAYLDDDDLYYPHHIETLVNALENQTDCQVAYSDLYKAYCRVMPEGGRQVLSKVVEVSRDFDRLFMLYFNHVLHVSLMHSRDLLKKTGTYNEELNVLIDWDMTRRLAFFSDFHHVHKITGEFYSPVGECDRISVQRRKDKSEYLRNVLAIRTTRPPKPWPKMKDLSIIFASSHIDQQAGQTIGTMWRHTFFPYELYLPLPQTDSARLNTDMPNIVIVPVSYSATEAQRIDAALERCNGDYVAIVPSGLAVDEMWVENPLHALLNSQVSREGFELEGSTDELWAAVVRQSDLQYARKSFPSLPVRQSLEAAGVAFRQPSFEELPFQFDISLKEARSAEKDGKWAAAAQMYEYIAEHHQNELWMKGLAAKAFFKAGGHPKASELCREVNALRPTVDTLLLEAKVRREKKRFNSAIELLENAKQILEGKELLWT